MQEHRESSQPSPVREGVLTWIALAITFFASVGVAGELTGSFTAAVARGDRATAAGIAVLAVIVVFLVYGGFVYQLTRIGYFRRLARHRRPSRAELEVLHEGDAPALTVLVPSYKEDPRVVMQTLLSAALQDYPHKRVVLLIDDPPAPRGAADREGLEAARALPRRIGQRLGVPARRFEAALQSFLARRAIGIDPRAEAARLAELHRQAAAWCEEQAAAEEIRGHTDAFFVDHVLLSLRDDHRARAAELDRAAAAPAEPPGAREIERTYRRLAALFRAEVESFERKRYENLSHEPNKAMNLNSYLGLMGQRLAEQWRDGRLYLVPAEPGAPADLEIPDSPYVITLDADSLLAPCYALRLVQVMEAPGHERIAVAQTPYSAIPNAPGALERIAGATTDIQYVIHQGFTAFGATYWVGANALLRRSALRDIAEEDTERGFRVTRYIQDRTVIEDTESTVDLVARGWTLHNYPERLAYSATPPDFGSLLIQRRRWANGGLIILPKLLRYILQGKARPGEGFLRVHYLVSISAVNVGLLVVLAVPFTKGVDSVWLPLTAVPYYAMYLRDLTLLGYRWTDLLRVYALNLLLIPVNLGGVLKSLQQAWTKAKIPFARTPKVEGRTAAAPIYVAAEYALVIHWLVAAGFDFAERRYSHGAFAVLNAAFLVYAIAAFVGLRESRADLAAAMPAWVSRTPRRRLPQLGAAPLEPELALQPELALEAELALERVGGLDAAALPAPVAVTGTGRRGARAA